MAASSSNTGDIIQRLNLVHAPHPTAQPPESAQDLLSAPSYDLAQLDLWTNVAFAPDEPFVPTDLNSDDGSDKDGKESASALVKRKRDILAKKAHFNTAAAAATAEHQSVGAGPSSAGGVHQAATALFPPATAPVVPYDLPGLLAIAGNQFSPDTMNINQILYGNPFQTAFAFPGSFPQFMPATAPAPAPQQHQSSHPAPTSGSTAPPPAKKAKRKSSTIITTTPVAPVRPTPAPIPEPQSPADDSGAEDDNGRPLTSAEDKRRRNTQASARFRLKKKERELAMEGKCKELESKVGELERECEALRRENGWLKGLVVGVTGGTGMPMTLPTGPGLPTLSSTTTSSGSSGKRKRDSTSSESSSSS